MFDKNKLKELIEATDSAIWLGNSSQQHEPDLVRLMSVAVDSENNQLVMTAPLRLCTQILENLNYNKRMSFLVASLASLESYQIKGKYLGHGDCTDEDIAFQEKYLLNFCEAAKRLGVPVINEHVFGIYFHQPSIRIRLSMDEVFEQTPKNNSGNRIYL